MISAIGSLGSQSVPCVSWDILQAALPANSVTKLFAFFTTVLVWLPIHRKIPKMQITQTAAFNVGCNAPRERR